MLKTAVVILNWNGLEFLRKFLGTVTVHSALPGTVVCVADNGSEDGSADWIRENHKDVRLLLLDKNYGFAGGYNIAIRQIEAEFYILLNSDVEVTSGWIEPLVACLEENGDVATCQPKILSYSSKDQFEYAGAAGGFIDKYGYPFCRGRVFGNVETDTGQYNDALDIFWSSGACMAVRAAAWKKCGGFDDSFFAHMEEIDLCWRFARAGYRNRYVPGSTVFHVGGGALPYNSPFKTYLNFRNSLFLLYKNLDDDRLSSVLLVRRILDGIAALKFLLSGHAGSFKAVLNAHMSFYKSLPKLKEKRDQVRKTGESKLIRGILNKSIVFEFYAKGKKTYLALTR